MTVTEQQLDDLAVLLIPRLVAIANLSDDEFIAPGTRINRDTIERRQRERRTREGHDRSGLERS